MNTQMVSVTDMQRNFKKVLASVGSNPLFVLKDSVPEAVLVSVEEYKRLVNLEKDILKMAVLNNIDYLSQKNKNFSDKEVDGDIEYARKHVSGNN